jgi:hypothetical protein
MCAGLFSYHFVHIYIVRDAMEPRFCARSSFNQHRNERVVSEDAPQREIL